MEWRHLNVVQLGILELARGQPGQVLRPESSLTLFNPREKLTFVDLGQFFFSNSVIQSDFHEQSTIKKQLAHCFGAFSYSRGEWFGKISRINAKKEKKTRSNLTLSRSSGRTRKLAPPQRGGQNGMERKNACC